MIKKYRHILYPMLDVRLMKNNYIGSTIYIRQYEKYIHISSLLIHGNKRSLIIHRIVSIGHNWDTFQLEVKPLIIKICFSIQV